MFSNCAIERGVSRDEGFESVAGSGSSVSGSSTSRPRHDVVMGLFSCDAASLLVSISLQTDCGRSLLVSIS